MDYLPTLGEEWPHSRGHVGKYSLHGASGKQLDWDGIGSLNGESLTWICNSSMLGKNEPTNFSQMVVFHGDFHPMVQK